MLENVQELDTCMTTDKGMVALRVVQCTAYTTIPTATLSRGARPLRGMQEAGRNQNPGQLPGPGGVQVEAPGLCSGPTCLMASTKVTVLPVPGGPKMM